jgi:hypothetical protein
MNIYKDLRDFSNASIKLGTITRVSYVNIESGLQDSADLLCASSKISMGRSLTVSTPQVPMLIPLLFMARINTPAFKVSNAIYVLDADVSSKPFYQFTT